MRDKFDERLLDKLSLVAEWGQHVDHGKDGKLGSDFQCFHHLANHGSTAESGQTLIPYGSQQLLNIGVSNELHA